ncbi:MAG TPA: iron-containing alcohol dehydrogenase, partial [Treponemataceae bacterium]|nr:iron-containing alcohol dehydrogenase [Treponemataceae bacterium]
SDTILEKAIELTWKGLDTATTVDTATSQEIFFAQGGCMTSFGSALSSLGQASLVSLAIESRYKIDSSLTTTILLPYIIEEASKYKGDKLAQIAFIMGLSNNPSDIQTNIDALLEEIRTKIALANLPARLKELSVSIEQLALCAEDAGALEIMNGLSRSMTSDDLFELIKQAY